MRTALSLGLALALVASAHAGNLDPESRTPYQMRVVVRTGDHPTLTRHFRAEVLKNVTSALQAALGPSGSVDGVDLNDTPPERREALWRLADEKGLEALDTVNYAVGGKTHFVFVDFADGKYEIRTRQHDGSSGMVSPFVGKAVHGDRGFVGRLAGLACAQDFGAVGTFDPNAAQVTVVLKAGDLGPMDAWVKKGDVFAVVQVKETRRAAPRPKGKGKDRAEAVSTVQVGTRLDGVLLQVIDGPRNGQCICKLHNRRKGLPTPDGATLGFRAVHLGTGEGKLKLQLTDAAGTPYRADTLQPRAGANDYPDGTRDREEMRFADGVFTSQEAFKNIAFVFVKAGDTPVAKVPVEVYPDRVFTVKVSLNPNSDPPPAVAAAGDIRDRVLSARVIQARAFEEVAALQKGEKPKALEYGQAAADSLAKESEALRLELDRLKERFKADSPPGLFDPAEGDLKALDAKTRELRAHLTKLKEVIRIESDPAAQAAQKLIEGLLLEAGLHVKNLDLGQAIAKYEEAAKLAMNPDVKAEIEKSLDALKKLWATKGPEHEAARKFIYETWARVGKPAEVRDALPEARKALAACKRAGDQIGLRKMYQVGPEILERFGQAVDMAKQDGEDEATLNGFEKIRQDLEKFLTEVGKEAGVDAK